MTDPCLPGLFTPRAHPIADTSRLAYERLLPTLNQKEYAVLLALCDHAGPAGLTGGELALAMGWDKCSVRPRLTGLHDKGLVERLAPRRSHARGETTANPYRSVVSLAALQRGRG